MSLITLPKDIIELIAKNAGVSSTYKLSITCKRFRDCLSDLFTKIKTDVTVSPIHYCKYLMEHDEEELLLNSLTGTDKKTYLTALIQIINMDKPNLVRQIMEKFNVKNERLLSISLQCHSFFTAKMLRKAYDYYLTISETQKFLYTDHLICNWLVFNRMIPFDDETIEDLIRTNTMAIKRIREAGFLKNKGNNFLIASAKCNNFFVFKLLVKCGLFKKNNAFDNIAPLDNLKCSYYLYKEGYKGKSPLYKFFSEEDDAFIIWLIKEGITFSEYQRNLDFFSIIPILKYHDKGSYNALYHFYKNAPVKLIKQALKDQYITEEEYKLNLIAVERQI